jgi:hypothetical protein
MLLRPEDPVARRRILIMACGFASSVFLAIAVIVTLQHVPGVEKIIRPAEAGVGTDCAQGSEAACEKLCAALSDVSTLKCVDHLSRVFPRVHDGKKLMGGGGGQSPGASPGQQPGGGGAPGNNPPPTTPAPPSPPRTTTPSPPPTTTTPDQGPLDLICHVNALGVRVCVHA